LPYWILCGEKRFGVPLAQMRPSALLIQAAVVKVIGLRTYQGVKCKERLGVFSSQSVAQAKVGVRWDLSMVSRVPMLPKAETPIQPSVQFEKVLSEPILQHVQ
jgi:hypothetical protein